MGLTIEDSVDEVGAILLAGPAPAVINALSMDSIAAIFSKEKFEQHSN
jgi:hypothetical protein